MTGVQLLTPDGPAPVLVVLDWSKHAVGKRYGRCRVCGEPALMRDANGKPCHKVCAEAVLSRRSAAAAADYPLRRASG